MRPLGGILTRGCGLAIACAAVALVLPAQSGASPATVSIVSVQSEAYGYDAVTVADSRAGSRLVLFVSGTEEGRATVTTRHRATFRDVELVGVGKLTFAEVHHRSSGSHYLLRLRYARYFEEKEGAVRLSAWPIEPVGVGSTEPTPPQGESAPTPPISPGPSEPACRNGTYVNSEGHIVCKPVESPTGPPPGATARCRDGTYSFSEHRSGTCSSHGGVAEWL